MGKKVKCKCPPPGAPAWLATFADMMTLLMAFFVLLLSFAEVDAAKYRAVSGSMREALGIVVKSKDENAPVGLDKTPKKLEPECTPSKCDELMKKRKDEAARLYELLREKLKGLGSDQDFFVQRTEQQVVIRIEEQGAFPSGSDKITKVFLPKVEMLRDVLSELEGGIRVTGHTDDIPIKNMRFRSNWDLSAARAVSVVHELLRGDKIAPERVSAVGYGASRPLSPNVDDESRARNRRVDIVLTPKVDPGVLEMLEGGGAGQGATSDSGAEAGDGAEATPGDGAEATPGDGAEATPGDGAEATPGDSGAADDSGATPAASE